VYGLHDGGFSGILWMYATHFWDLREPRLGSYCRKQLTDQIAAREEKRTTIAARENLEPSEARGRRGTEERYRGNSLLASSRTVKPSLHDCGHVHL
jgi:hypothetical protein